MLHDQTLVESLQCYLFDLATLFQQMKYLKKKHDLDV